ncbi:complement factor H-like [Protopterus annectens]|uniref:complement factor H-like n=1 Tax=Protopterus annectens TaxID=7888 RepID=UPI001CFC3178|nr:complement factor H-like [Protopterus annectens]
MHSCMIDKIEMSMLGTIFPLILLTITCAQEGKECSSPLSDPAEELIGKRLQSYPHNTLLKYSCRPGYIKLGTIYYLCENGSWKNINHVKCRKKSCGHPGDAQFGTFRLTEGEDFVFGARVEYSCDDGYHMVSQRTFRVCMADGWSNDIPHCEVVGSAYTVWYFSLITFH